METGFPSPAQGYEEQPIDILRFLMPRPECTFFMRLGESDTINASLQKNDILVVDRSIEPKNGNLIVVQNETAFLCGTYAYSAKPAFLRGETLVFFTENIFFFGTVTRIIRDMYCA